MGSCGTKTKEGRCLMKALIASRCPSLAERDIVIEKDRGFCSPLLIHFGAGRELWAGTGIWWLWPWGTAVAVLPLRILGPVVLGLIGEGLGDRHSAVGVRAMLLIPLGTHQARLPEV